jgi:polyisoprenoid-binding protein YceI
MIRVLSVTIALLLLSVAPTAAKDAASPPGSITFVAENKVATANGVFREWKIVEAKIDEANPASSRIELEIDLSSIDTGNTKRDDHLRNPDYFEVEKYPTASVVIDNVRYQGGETFDADVTLDLHGKRKTFSVPFRIEDRAGRRISAAFVINRMDFEVGSPYSFINPLSIDEEIPMKVTATIPASATPSAP